MKLLLSEKTCERNKCPAIYFSKLLPSTVGLLCNFIALSKFKNKKSVLLISIRPLSLMQQGLFVLILP